MPQQTFKIDRQQLNLFFYRCQKPDFCEKAAPVKSYVPVSLLLLFVCFSKNFHVRAGDLGSGQEAVFLHAKPDTLTPQPVFNMGDTTLTTSCSGTLYDSGGPGGDYANNENHVFTICPDSFHQCIIIHIETFDLENDFDFLRFFAGENTGGLLLQTLTGSGGNVEIQVFGTCATIQFTSDFSVTDAGFELNWMCSPDSCTVPPPVTCDNAVPVTQLPFLATGLTTCEAGYNYNAGPCNNDLWMSNEDFVFTYESPGNECISVRITGTNPATGVGIFNGCPDTATQCIAQAGGGLGTADPALNAVYLELPGTYFFVVDNAYTCTPFHIEIQQVKCPVVHPSAALCGDALSLNGCGELPAIVSVAPGTGDPNFIVPGTNDGCWGTFPLNFTFFSFQAQADGEFGFVIQAADPNEASDIDFQVWGPTGTAGELCSFAAAHQPLRSSYSAGADPTGLANVHPVTGLPVTDTCEPAAGDDFVKKIDVTAGEWYLVLINDWGNQIVSGAVSIDFGGTTPGVLNSLPVVFQVSPDTVTCPGQPIPLWASGGSVYEWLPAGGLSCSDCPSPVATVTVPTRYDVVVHTICVTDTLFTDILMLEADAGPDFTVCSGEVFQIAASANMPDLSYLWSGPPGFLGCTACQAPTVTAAVPGTFTLLVSAIGPLCSAQDEMTLTVLPVSAPGYHISGNQSVCLGAPVELGGPPVAGTTYQWTSSPPGFFSNDPNPVVPPAVPTLYYLEITNAECPQSSFDSVFVSVAAEPIIHITNDTFICRGDTVLLGQTIEEPDVSYVWSPQAGLSDPAMANPLASPTESTHYYLMATREGCTIAAAVSIEVVVVEISIAGPDSLYICQGDTVSFMADAMPTATTVSWTPDDGSLNTQSGPFALAAPQSATTYIVQAETSGCTHADTVFVGVDSLPAFLNIHPADTVICEGGTVLLSSPEYDLAHFPALVFQWLPTDGLLFPDNVYNQTVRPLETTVYQRIATNGKCADTAFATITVLPGNTVTLEPADPAICPGEAVQLNATSTFPVVFHWQPSTDLGCASCPNPIASPGATTVYAVFYENECGDTLSESVTVTVHPGIMITELASDNGMDTLFQGTPVTLTATAAPPAVFFLWSNGSTSETAQVILPNGPTAAYSVTVTGESGCTDSREIVLVLLEHLFDIPNVFSPNNDGINDLFQVVLRSNQIEVLSCEIWNRWGQKIHESKNTNAGWDGTQGGKPAPSDVYIYRIAAQMPDGSIAVRTGDVTLLR